MTTPIHFDQPGKCAAAPCKKRLKLTDVECRCGHIFCAVHRLPATHDCRFDYKSLGRERIAKENQAILPKKITKI